MSDSVSRSVVHEFGDFRLEPQRRSLSLLDGRRVDIAAKTFDALQYLVEHAGTVVARGELMKTLWPRTIVEDNHLNKLIAALRRTLGDDGQRYVVTVQGRGYQFVASVRRIAEPTDPVPEPTPAAPPGQPQNATAPEPRGVVPRVRALRPWWFAVAAALLIGVGISLVGWQRTWSLSRAPSTSLGSVIRVLPATSYAGDEASPSLSPDGRQVAFSWDGGSEAAGNLDIYIAALGGAAPLRLTDDPAVDRDPVWSPDGTEIAFLRSRGSFDLDIIVVPALGGAERKLHSTRLHLSSRLREVAPLLAWSPDGAYLVFTSLNDDSVDTASYLLHALSIETGGVHRLTNDPAVYDSSPAVSPDGRWLAFSRFGIEEGWSSGLMVQRLGSGLKPEGRPVAVPSGPSGTPHSPQWLSNGERLAFLNGGTLYESEVGGETRAVYTASGAPGSVRYRGFSLHREAGRSVAVLAVEAALPDIWAMPLDPMTRAATGPPTRRIASSGSDDHPQLSPDGQTLAFISRRSGRVAVWLADADGKRSRRITDIGATVIGYPRWSPDGRQLAFHLALPGRERQIYLLSEGAGIARPFTSGCCADWSPDGNHLYVGEIGAVGMIARVKMADGTKERLFEGDVARATIDGANLIYSKTREAGLFMRSAVGDVASNPEEKLVDDHVLGPGNTAPADDGFYYVGLTPGGMPRALRFYDYALRAARDVAALPPRMGQGISLSPDGRTLLYGASIESGADLVTLEFE